MASDITVARGAICQRTVGLMVVAKRAKNHRGSQNRSRNPRNRTKQKSKMLKVVTSHTKRIILMMYIVVISNRLKMLMIRILFIPMTVILKYVVIT